MRGVTKYLVCQKKFTVENNIQEQEEDLGNTQEMVADFKERMSAEVLSAEVQRQERIEVDFRRRELLGKYTAKIQYRWNDGEFKKEYLRKLERNQ